MGRRVPRWHFASRLGREGAGQTGEGGGRGEGVEKHRWDWSRKPSDAICRLSTAEATQERQEAGQVGPPPGSWRGDQHLPAATATLPPPRHRPPPPDPSTLPQSSLSQVKSRIRTAMTSSFACVAPVPFDAKSIAAYPKCREPGGGGKVGGGTQTDEEFGEDCVVTVEMVGNDKISSSSAAEIWCYGERLGDDI